MRGIGLGAGLCLLAMSAFASPINVGGYSFSSEAAFADEAFLVSGTIRFTCLGGGWGVNPPASTVAEAVAGSDLSHCVNHNTGNSGIVEAVFSNNLILNDAQISLSLSFLVRLQPGRQIPERTLE